MIRAPFSGRVGLRRVSVGTLISPGDVITTLDDTSVIKLDFSVPENFLSTLREGLAVRATAPAFPGRTFTGKVASIDSRVDMNTRAVTVRALLANEDGALKPGMFLNVALANDERESLFIPEQALTPEAERQFVFVVADGKAQRREVRIGARRPGSVEVLAGLTAGEQVIVEGTQKVRDGVAGARHRNRGGCGARCRCRALARGQHRHAGEACANERDSAMMISDLSVRRPVFATVMSLLLFILGLGAITRLSLREFPDVDRPVVNIETRYRGASSDVVESRITQVIENEISGIEGVERLNSSSRDERSQINVEFTLERDLDSAANDVRERLSRVAARLPLEADPPQITKVDSGTDPIIWLNVASTQRNMLELTDYMERYLVDQFSTLEGVANVRMNGARRYAMRVWLSAREPRRAPAHGGRRGKRAAARKRGDSRPAASSPREREFTLRTDTNLRTEEDFRNLVVGRGPDGYLVRLGEVAEVRLASDDDRSISRSNGAIGLSMAIIPQSKANVLATSNAGEGTAGADPADAAQGHHRRDQHRQRRVHRGVAQERGVRAVRDADPGAHRHLPVPRHRCAPR